MLCFFFFFFHRSWAAHHMGLRLMDPRSLSLSLSDTVNGFFSFNFFDLSFFTKYLAFETLREVEKRTSNISYIIFLIMVQMFCCVIGERTLNRNSLIIIKIYFSFTPIIMLDKKYCVLQRFGRWIRAKSHCNANKAWFSYVCVSVWDVGCHMLPILVFFCLEFSLSIRRKRMITHYVLSTSSSAP